MKKWWKRLGKPGAIGLLTLLAAVTAGAIGWTWANLGDEPQTTSISTFPLGLPPASNITQNVTGNNNTAIGQVNGPLTINGLPRPHFSLSESTRTKLDDGSYQYTTVFTVDAPYPVPNVTVTIGILSAKSFTLQPLRTGITMLTKGTNTDGRLYVNIQNAAGSYELSIVSGSDVGRVPIDVVYE